MDEVAMTVIRKADLRQAALNEATHWRNLLPQEPAWPLVVANPGPFAGVVQSRLRSGAVNGSSVVVFARKAHQSVRPVPVLGIIERIALRALTDLVLADIDPPARDSGSYESFVSGPLHAAFANADTIGHRLTDAQFEYVIQGDISAFYQYVDHELLLNELEARTELIPESRLLVELLREVQGQRFGLPQLLNPADRLSELYIQAVERDIRRREIPVWRYNDDFRFVANGYGNAQKVLEQLAVSSHAYGLVVNESKSSILLFRNYYWRHMVRSSDAEEEEFDPDNIVVWDSDYPDLEASDLVGDAESTFARLSLPPTTLALDTLTRSERPIDIRNLSAQDLRDLRRALAIAANTANNMALPRLRDLVSYAPELTPRICDYMVALHKAGTDIGESWDSLTSLTEVLNEWQRIWIVYVARSCRLGEGDDRRQWLMQQHSSAPTGLLHAESALALAQIGAIDFSELDQALRTQPSALAQWYVLGIKDLPGLDPAVREAVKNSDPLYRVLLEAD